MRSTGWVILDFNNKLINFGIIETSAKDFPDNEDLIIYIRNEIEMIINYFNKIEQFVIEGLSFNSVSASKDVIAAVYWTLRVLVKEKFPNILIGSIPVMSWRSKTINKEEKEFAKKNCRDPLKNAVFIKLSNEIQKSFLLYIEAKGVKTISVFDLADAYFLAIYRNSLNK
jgi:hypothetical protein